MPINSLQFSLLDKQQIPLVNQFYRAVYKKGLANKSEQVFILKDQKIHCAARMKTVQGALLLTGVACLSTSRGQGFATLLIKNILALQQYPVYCFPYPQLQDFYQNLGFIQLESSLLPAKLRSQYQGYCRSRPLLCMIYPSNK